MTDDVTKRPQNIAFRPARGSVPPSDEQRSYLLEMFVLDGPEGTIAEKHKHAVWLHQLKAGGYRWKCSCGAKRDHHELDAMLLADARAHFAQRWEPAAVPICHPAAIWNDRATKQPLPRVADLEKLAADLARGEPLERSFVDVEVVHRCGICGQTFEIKPDDPHWVTGRGPICPTEAR